MPNIHRLGTGTKQNKSGEGLFVFNSFTYHTLKQLNKQNCRKKQTKPKSFPNIPHKNISAVSSPCDDKIY